MSSEQLARQLLNTPHLNGGYNTEIKRFTKILDRVLAEREAQARAEEREAAKGLVEALDNMVTYALNSNLAIPAHAISALATYRATQTERKG